MAILVTGGTGFIGSHTCVELINKGYEVVILDNLYNSSKEVLNRIEKICSKRPTFIEGDIRDRELLLKLFKTYDISAVIHFAGLKAVGESVVIPLKYFDNNVSGTITLLEVMNEVKCKNIIFSSSATVYGNPKKNPIDEDMETGAVTNAYGRTKVYIEGILKDLYTSDHEWNIILLRYFNPIGAHPSGTMGEDPNGIPNNLVPYITKVGIGKLPYLSVYGNDYQTHDGTGVRDYIHVCDLAYGHVCALEKIKEKKGLSIYNLGTGIGYSVLDIVKGFELAMGKQLSYKIVGRREGDIDACYSDPSKAYKEMGFKTKYSLADMCADSWRWQTLNPNGYKK